MRTIIRIATIPYRHAEQKEVEQLRAEKLHLSVRTFARTVLCAAPHLTVVFILLQCHYVLCIFHRKIVCAPDVSGI